MQQVLEEELVSPVDLPLALQADLKKNYQSYWISNLFEAATSEGTTYYITIEDADQSIVLKSDNARDWDQYKKVKKSWQHFKRQFFIAKIVLVCGKNSPDPFCKGRGFLSRFILYQTCYAMLFQVNIINNALRQSQFTWLRLQDYLFLNQQIEKQ